MYSLLPPFIPEAMAQGGGGTPGAAGLLQLLPLVILFGLFYFLLIRPQTRRAKEHRAMVSALQKGDEVVTSGGTLGRVTQVGEVFVSLEVADNVNIKVQRQMIQAVMPKGTIKSA
jgi:preprotein translocase subunit YajC